MAGITQEQFERITKEVRQAWDAADSRDAGFRVITDFGRKYGYKNVIAAIEGRVPKQLTREKSVDRWLDDRHNEETTG